MFNPGPPAPRDWPVFDSPASGLTRPPGAVVAAGACPTPPDGIAGQRSGQSVPGANVAPLIGAARRAPARPRRGPIPAKLTAYLIFKASAHFSGRAAEAPTCLRVVCLSPTPRRHSVRRLAGRRSADASRGPACSRTTHSNSRQSPRPAAVRILGRLHGATEIRAWKNY